MVEIPVALNLLVVCLFVCLSDVKEQTHSVGSVCCFSAGLSRFMFFIITGTEGLDSVHKHFNVCLNHKSSQLHSVSLKPAVLPWQSVGVP